MHPRIEVGRIARFQASKSGGIGGRSRVPLSSIPVDPEHQSSGPIMWVLGAPLGVTPGFMYAVGGPGMIGFVHCASLGTKRVPSLNRLTSFDDPAE